MRPAWVALPALLVVLAAVRPAYTQGTQTLECSKSAELKAVGVDWQCENFGSIAARQNTTYLLTVDANAATYQQYDINITLISLTGDADLAVVTPGATSNLASTHNVGPDIVFVYRTELAAGQYQVVVLGYAPKTEYQLTVQLVERMRELRPLETLALGQMMVDCCAADPTSCTELKAQFPQLASNSSDINPDFCYMHGNVCSMDGELLELGAFAGGDLSCEFPGAGVMSAFQELYRLDLSGNRIYGNITEVAETLAELEDMEYVDLGMLQLTGPLDSACGLAATRKLESLDLLSNGLTGSIPACLTELPELVELHLDFNQLTGTIPAFPPANSPLVYFSAAFQVGFLSGLSGPVPQSLGRLPNLAYLDLGGNMLSGVLPPSLPASMIDLRMADNALTGSIPSSYGLMQSLVSLELQGNNLAGALPGSLAALPGLKLLDASNNFLAGPLPPDWSGASQLTLLMLPGNLLTGPLPASLATCNELVVLDLHSNALSGTLEEFAFQTQANREDLHSGLRYFDVSNNTLSGELQRVEGLRDLAVFSNAAPIVYTADAVAVLSANSSSSTIRTRAETAPRTFDLSYNNFGGQLPQWLVSAVAGSIEDVTLILTGDNFTCPPGGYVLTAQPPQGRLDGLYCFNAGSSDAVVSSTTMSDVSSLIYMRGHSLSGGAIFGIIVAVLVGVVALACLGYFLYVRRGALLAGASGSFQRFQKFDGGEGGEAPPMQNGTANIYASTGGSRFGNGRMVYPDMQEIEMGDPVREQLGRESPTKPFSVNLKSGRNLQLP